MLWRSRAKRKERRAHERVPYGAAAIVEFRRRRFTSRTVDLSESGLLVVGDAAGGLRPGDDVAVSVKVPKARKMVRLDAVVVRIDRVDGRALWAVRVPDPPPSIIHAIDDVINAADETPTDPKAAPQAKPEKKKPKQPIASRPHHGEEVFQETEATDGPPSDPNIPQPLPE